MSASVGAESVIVFIIAGMLGLIVLIGVYVWYALALSKLFSRLGGEGWKGWVPILNEAEILYRGGVPAWSVVFYFIPLVNLYGLYLKIVATHRINISVGRGAGATVLAILLPPVWATLLAWGDDGNPERGRAAVVPPTLEARVAPVMNPAVARDASGYTIPSLVPPTAPAAPAAPALVQEVPGFTVPAGFIAAPAAAPAPAEAPAPVAAPANFAPPAPPASPAAQPAAPTAQPAAPTAQPAVPTVQPGVVRAVPPMFAPTTQPDAVQARPLPDVPIVRPASFEQLAPSAPAPPPVASVLLGADALPEDVDHTVVIPRRTDDDDLDMTVVVDRRSRMRWHLVLEDGTRLPLSGTAVVLGRNPDANPGEQKIAVPDRTRTLSKTHARLDLQGEEWRLTDLHSTNGVVLVADDGTETLLDAGESVLGTGRFILGEVALHVVRDSAS